MQLKKSPEESYDFKKYLISIEKYPIEYVDKVIDYYKHAFMDFLMSGQELTNYRQALVDLINGTTLVDENGLVITDKDEDEDVSVFGNIKSGIAGLIKYAVVQYEHDSIVDTYSEKYKTNEFPYYEFSSGDKSTKPDSFNKHHIFDTNLSEIKQHSDRTNVKVKKLIYKYGYKENKLYTCLCYWNDNPVIVKFITSIKNPCLTLLDQMFDNDNINIRIMSTFVETTSISGAKILKVYEGGWALK